MFNVAGVCDISDDDQEPTVISSSYYIMLNYQFDYEEDTQQGRLQDFRDEL